MTTKIMVDHNDDWGYNAICPVCGNDYVHFEKPEYVINDKDPAWGGAWFGRGEAIYIPMWCENCHATWDFRIGHHKGHTFINDEILEDKKTFSNKPCYTIKCQRCGSSNIIKEDKIIKQYRVVDAKDDGTFIYEHIDKWPSNSECYCNKCGNSTIIMTKNEE